MDIHCTNPKDCPTNRERLRDMEQIKDSYDKSQQALEENTQQIQDLNLNLVEQSGKIDTLLGAVKEYKEENEKEHDKAASGQSDLHSRVTGLALHTEKELGNLRAEFIKKDAALEVGQAQVKGAVRGKVDWAEIIKLVMLISTILGIYKYVLPAG